MCLITIPRSVHACNPGDGRTSGELEKRVETKAVILLSREVQTLTRRVVQLEAAQRPQQTAARRRLQV